MTNKTFDQIRTLEKTVTLPLKELHRRCANAATILAFMCAGFMVASGFLGYYLGKQDAKKEAIKTPCPCAQKISSQAIPCQKQARKIEHIR
ncbi:MAG: hypothetical protein IKV03_04780 [Alphaproteobacteria bacterium]|nr:hypothetical protein [Alphaproteobacteria bacterium]